MAQLSTTIENVYMAHNGKFLRKICVLIEANRKKGPSLNQS